MAYQIVPATGTSSTFTVTISPTTSGIYYVYSPFLQGGRAHKINVRQSKQCVYSHVLAETSLSSTTYSTATLSGTLEVNAGDTV